MELQSTLIIVVMAEAIQQVNASIGIHLSDEERYNWANDSIAVERLDPMESGGVEIVLDWLEVVGSEISD